MTRRHHVYIPGKEISYRFPSQCRELSDGQVNDPSGKIHDLADEWRAAQLRTYLDLFRFQGREEQFSSEHECEDVVAFGLSDMARAT